MQLLSLRKNDLSPAKSRGFFQSPQLLDLLAGSDVVNHSFLFESFLSYGFWAAVLFYQHLISSHVSTTLLGDGDTMVESTVPTLKMFKPQ